MTLSKTLVDVLNGEASGSIYTSLVVECAIKNKVLLQVLRNLRIENSLRRKQEMALRESYEALLEIARDIQNIDYAVIKFFKPIAYVPSDIDLLVKRAHLEKLLNILKSLGYKLSVLEPNCISLKGKTIIDVYINPDFMNIPYMSGEKLLNFYQSTKINGVEVKTLKPEAEAVVALSHGIYKEQILTLNDYYTARRFLNNESMKIAEELWVTDALVYSLKLFEEIELGLIEVPIRVPIRDAAKLILLKIAEDPLSKRYLPHACLKFLDRRTPMLVKSRLFRQTY